MPKKPVAAAASIDNSTQITNSQFTGVHWDAKAIDTVQTVAEGLVENARALAALANLFASQHINIECLLKIEPVKPTGEPHANR